MLAALIAETGLLEGAALDICISFASAAFFVAAGSCAQKSYEADMKEHLKGLVAFLLLPYLWASLFRLVRDAVFLMIRGNDDSLQLLYNDLWDAVSFFGISLLWFLPAVGVSLLFFLILKKRFSAKAVILIILAVTVVYFVTSAFVDNGVYEWTMMSPITWRIFLLQVDYLACRVWVGLFFLLVGSLSCSLAEHWQGQAAKLAPVGALLSVAGGVIIAFAGGFDLKRLEFGTPGISLAGTVMLAVGMYLLSAWVQTIKPVDALGRYALIAMTAPVALGGTELAGLVGRKVFLWLDHNFITRITTVAVLLAFTALCIVILRIKCFSFLYGGFPFEEAEEEVRHDI